MSGKLISTKKAAELIGVSQRTIQNWVDNGKLNSAITPGGHRRINPDDVNNFLVTRKSAGIKGVKPLTPLMENKESDQLRVLIVEDDVNVLHLYEHRFAKFAVRHELYLANNAFEGLIKAGMYQPHIIFTDIKMPGLNGLQMIDLISKVPELKQTRAVVITGLSTQEIIVLGNLPEGLMILPKPIPFNTIETILYQQASALKFAAL